MMKVYFNVLDPRLILAPEVNILFKSIYDGASQTSMFLRDDLLASYKFIITEHKIE